MLKKTGLLLTLLTTALVSAHPCHSAAAPAKKNKDVTAGKVLVQSLGGVGVGLLGGLAGWGVCYVAGSAIGDKDDGISPGYVGGFYGARTRNDGASAGMEAPGAPSMGARPYRFELVRLTF